MEPLKIGGNRTVASVIAAYYLTIALMVLGTLFPQQRLWAFNWWAYMPFWAQLLALLTALVAPLVLRRCRTVERPPLQDRNIAVSQFVFVSVAAALVLVVVFVLLRTRTHFHGDGYQLLSLMAQGKFISKGYAIGEPLIHLWLADLIPGDPHQSALMSFRILSSIAGAFFVIAVLVSARVAFRSFDRQVLFALILTSGGYLLLFFGYVENYSLVVLATTGVCLTGLLASRGHINAWWTLIPLVLATWLHIFGLSLLPAVIVLLVSKQPWWRRFMKLSPSLRISAGVILIVVIGCIAAALLGSDLTFRIALVPLTAHQFTPGDYTLFSGKHLLDYLNLVFILVPGILVAITGVGTNRSSSSRVDSPKVFLWLLVIPTLITAFIFDPKLGMPRDWDLFSFIGVPISILTAWELVSRNKRYTAMLFVFCGLLVLIPRVVTLVVPEYAEHQYRRYLDLDPARVGIAGWTILKDYYEAKGDSTAADETINEMKQRHAEFGLLDRAEKLIRQTKPREALALLRQVKDVNPRYFSVWHSMGIAFTQLHELDSARHCLRIANALNPYSAAVSLALANVTFVQNDTSATKKYLQEAWKRDSAYVKPVLKQYPRLRPFLELDD